jgi:exosortase
MTTTTLATRIRQTPIALLLPFALLVIIYLPAIADLVSDWWADSNYSHGFLVPLVSLWLIWNKREEIKAVPASQDSTGVIPIVFGLLLFVLANGGAELFSLRISLVICLFGLVLLLFGKDVIRHTWFEIVFLVFMVPIPYVIYFAATFPMQLLASKVTAGVLNTIGMGVVRQGNIIHIQGYSLEVAEACSGMRSVMSLLALGALYAHLTQRRLSAKTILFLSTIPIAVVANVVRVLITSLLAYTVTTAVTDEPLHSLLGLMLFVVAFIQMFIVGAILRRIFK